MSEDFRKDYPAHIGYTAEEIRDIAHLQAGGDVITSEQIAEVARQFNRADHSNLHDLLSDIVADVTKDSTTHMKRFLTVETYEGTIEAFSESDHEAKKAVNSDGVAAWVWQFAESKEQAVNQHHIKHDLYDADAQLGREIKETY